MGADAHGGAGFRNLGGKVKGRIPAGQAHGVGIHAGAGQNVLAAGQPCSGGALRVCKHLFGAAGAQHLPAIHHDHIPAQAVGFVTVVGDQQRRAAKPGQQAAHFALHFLTQVAVQRTERLVQHQNFGPAHKDACQRGALLLSAGKLGRVALGKGFQPHGL